MGITFKSVRQNNIVELIFWLSSIFNSIFESLRLYFIKKRKSKSNSYKKAKDKLYTCETIISII